MDEHQSEPSKLHLHPSADRHLPQIPTAAPPCRPPIFLFFEKI
jgi:hypothetical protein